MAVKLFYSPYTKKCHNDFISCYQQSKQNDLSQDPRTLQGDMTALLSEPRGSAGVGLIGDNDFVF